MSSFERPVETFKVERTSPFGKSFFLGIQSTIRNLWPSRVSRRAGDGYQLHEKDRSATLERELGKLLDSSNQ